jgi:8-oxo-dGTP diphosphatase/2-hydroxy-dATP diphosphatase
MKKLLTLCLVTKGDEVLLAMKKRGFGAGHYNGFGGKVELNETVESATARELFEEAGLTALSLEKVGVLEFSFSKEPNLELEMHIFKTDDFLGIPIESDEMRPEWFNVDDIPYRQMWTSDTKWFPLFLAGQKFIGSVRFDKPASATHTALILEENLTPVESFVDGV